MDILISNANPTGPRCREALTHLRLPHLDTLLRLSVPKLEIKGKADGLTPLHELFLAQATGSQGPDGLLPWAALQATQQGLTKLHGVNGWAHISPCHWTVNADHVAMSDPTQMALTADDYSMLWAAIEPYFAEDGITLFANAKAHVHHRWLAHGAVFRDLPTASLDRVAGQLVDPWMPRQPQAKNLRRLQNEMQMLLYTHPLNDQRSRYRLPPVNSFWVSGTGTPVHAQNTTDPLTLTVHSELKAGARLDDPALWTSAWQVLDRTVINQAVNAINQGGEVRVILCGENQAVSLSKRPEGILERIKRRWVTPKTLALLQSL